MPKYPSYCTMELTSQEIMERLKETDICLVPIGSHEMHGYHLPLGCDSYQALTIATRAAAKANVLSTNVVWTGYSPHHVHNMGEGVGTITLSGETLRRVLYEIAKSLIYAGFNKIIYVNYHGSNIKVMDEVLRRIRYETGAFVAAYCHSLERDHKLFKDIIDTLPKDVPPAWHSGQVETSVVMDCAPHLVKMERAVRDTAHAPAWLGPKFAKDDGAPHVMFEDAENIFIPMEHNEYCNTATIGDPFRATPELGARIVGRMVDHLASFCEEVKKIKVEIKTRDNSFRAW
jgi:creatinine amidohydrolase